MATRHSSHCLLALCSPCPTLWYTCGHLWYCIPWWNKYVKYFILGSRTVWKILVWQSQIIYVESPSSITRNQKRHPRVSQHNSCWVRRSISTRWPYIWQHILSVVLQIVVKVPVRSTRSKRWWWYLPWWIELSNPHDIHHVKINLCPVKTSDGWSRKYIEYEQAWPTKQGDERAK